MVKAYKRIQRGKTHDFSTIPHANIPRSSFRRSHSVKSAFDSAYLVPIYADEVLPGDTFNLKMTSVARLATPTVPFVDNLWMDFFFFFVPNRLLWTNFQRFMGERDPDPDSSIDYTVPTVAMGAGGQAVGSLADYLGIPSGINLTVNALHFRAYNLIWNEWFRSEGLQDSVVVDKDDGPDTIGDYQLLKRNKRHDYFTSALPWPQRGDDVELPLGAYAPIVGKDYAFDDTGNNNNIIQVLDGGGIPRRLLANATYLEGSASNAGALILEADLSSATASTINEIREAFQLQKLLERDARGGTRYTEIIQSHFRVTSPDSRLQRPEYLGGGSSLINITPIAQTSESGTTKQGTLAAVGFHSQHGTGFTKSFVEHGVILGLANVRADLTYQQGIHKMWKRQTKYDFYWPSLANLGEQELYNYELWADGSANDALVFGYQERWAEYRTGLSRISGILRSDAASSLDVWHLAQDFASLPSLNSDFITEAPPVSRVVAVPSEPEIIFDAWIDLICARPLPAYSVPGLVDHF